MISLNLQTSCHHDVTCDFSGVRSVSSSGQKVLYDLESKVNQAVFPGIQGGPHNNAIAGMHDFPYRYQ